MVVVSTQWSWNSARLIALVLNALYGLEQYYNEHHKELNVDGLFGLRIIEGVLRDVHNESIRGHEIHPEISAEIRNLSIIAGVIADKALPFVADRNSKYFNQFQYVLKRPYKVNFTPQRTDERLRWKEKQLKARKTDEIHPAVLFVEKESDSCFAELLFTMNYDSVTTNHSCKLSDRCLKRMVEQRGFTGYHLAHQILYTAVAFQTPCIITVSNFIASTNNQTIGNFLTEYCTNLIDELGIFLRNPKITARLDHSGRDLLMEQIFACGQFGFVELSSLHLLASVLSWQNPVLGCFVSDKTTDRMDVTSQNGQNMASFPRRILFDIIHEDLCSTHSATVAAGALVVFLRFLLNRGPWPEYYLADQPVVVHSIAAEDKFRQFHYGRWVRDSFIQSVRHMRPPHIGWSPDLLAYLLLLCIILGGSIAMHFCYKPKMKQFYHFSYKKL